MMDIIQRLKRSYEYLKTITEYKKQGKMEAIIPLASEINTEGYILKKSDRFVKQHNSLFAMGAYSVFKDTVGNTVSVLVVVTDDLYELLSNNTKRFIILHEQGHFNLQLDKIVSHKNYKRNLIDEYQADEYAINELGTDKVIEALQEMKSVVWFPDMSRELNMRIKNIKNKE